MLTVACSVQVFVHEDDEGAPFDAESDYIGKRNGRFWHIVSAFGLLDREHLMPS